MATMTAKVGERERGHRRSRHEQCGHRNGHAASGVLPIGLDVAPVIKDIDRAGEQTEHDKGASCPPNGRGMPISEPKKQQWKSETVLHSLPDAQQSYRRPDHLSTQHASIFGPQGSYRWPETPMP